MNEGHSYYVKSPEAEELIASVLESPGNKLRTLMLNIQLIEVYLPRLFGVGRKRALATIENLKGQFYANRNYRS